MTKTSVTTLRDRLIVLGLALLAATFMVLPTAGSKMTAGVAAADPRCAAHQQHRWRESLVERAAG
ncbi:Uncharacterised protein [Mycobacteroides abscessus subsp. massiliense]|nr:Uncharacterised protein [Mycobacteroides abscessus subsp. massiliense]